MEDFDHGIPDNPYNKHAWVLGKPEIGEGVWIGAFCLIDALHSQLKIGKWCDISSGAQIITHSTVRRCISERKLNFIDKAPVEIGDYCFIGTNAVILMGTKIGHHSVIAAGAVIEEGSKIPPYSLVAGIPAKIIGTSKKYLKNLPIESVSVVIPAYNEEETIEKVVKDALKNLSFISKNYEVVLVDDGSVDNTGKIIDQLSEKNKKVRAIHHKVNQGFTGAIKTSLKSANHDLVFLAPADGQFDFKELARFVKTINGYDAAIGYRIKNDETFIRKFNSKVFHLLCKVLLDINLKEISTVSMWRKSMLDSLTIDSSQKSAMLLPEIISKAIKKDFKFTEVPIHWHERKGGKSKGANPTVIVKTFIEMFRLSIKNLYTN